MTNFANFIGTPNPKTAGTFDVHLSLPTVFMGLDPSAKPSYIMGIQPRKVDLQCCQDSPY
jgi:hypothetical protein